jgi:hypothetical protein
MRLELTLQETAQLRRCLTDALARHERDGEDEGLKNLFNKIVAVEARSTRQVTCPVCQQLFTQETVGRTGRYCSPACKQKAYRQRRDQWRRVQRPRFSA